ncbi:MAG: hypothetical protein J6D42_11560 [Clostridia bacterium]|nr:hypothetical protein [Clostridia bacterium]
MKIFNLPRGAGKTHRMLYASEFNNAPILCKDETYKEVLIHKSNILGIKIPTPITVRELISGKRCDRILIDESIMVLNELVKCVSGGRHVEILGCTLSDEENGKLCRWYENGGMVDRPIGREEN